MSRTGPGGEPPRRLRLRDLRNLGPASEAALAAAGVTTPEQLDDLGAAAAYRLVLEHGHPPHTTLLWALAGAVLDIHWRALPAAVRAGLRAELDQDPDADARPVGQPRT